MLCTGLILWASLLTGAWPAAPIQDQVPATPRVRLSFKGQRLLCSSFTPSFLTALAFTAEDRIEIRAQDKLCSHLGKDGERAGSIRKDWSPEDDGEETLLGSFSSDSHRWGDTVVSS